MVTHGERFEGHAAHKQWIYKRRGGLDLRASFITSLSCVVKRREKGGNGLRRVGHLAGLTGLESGITQMPVNCDMPELERGDSHKPVTPACKEKDLPSCIGDIILMVNLAK